MKTYRLTKLAGSELLSEARLRAKNINAIKQGFDSRITTTFFENDEELNCWLANGVHVIVKEIAYPYECPDCGEIDYFTDTDIDYAQGVIYCDTCGAEMEKVTK